MLDVVGVGSVQDITYQWDSVGNLTSRHNTSSAVGNSKNLLERFHYDGLNRLTRSTVNGTTKDVRYDSLGNITDKTGVGSYTYGQNGHGPHAVTATSDGVRYHYDANGNLTHDTAVGQWGGRTLRYTSFDKLSWVQKGNHTVAFKYNPNRSRYLREDTNTSTGVTTETRYLGAVERIQKSNSSTIEWKRYINGVAVYTVTTNASGDIQGTEKAYLFKDHLGSIDVITDGLGVVIESLNFDPWGERRNALDWESLDIASLLDFNADFLETTTRGFTGHEMLDEVGLIHMNGRVYDPRLGRFLQADPNIDGATDTQGYNRYSYVANNPLSYTDPTGYFKLRQFVGAIVAVVGAWFCGQPCAQIGWQVVALGAASGAAGAAANGGNIFQGAIIGGISAGAFSGVAGADFTGGAWAKVAEMGAYGTVGGITSVLQGGKFGHGFVSAGFSAPLGGAVAKVFGGGRTAQFISKVIVGGTLSEVTGGKFANGASTVAFAAIVSAGAQAARKPTPQEVTYAKLANGVYAPEFTGADGYTRVKTHTDDNGLQAALFVDEAGHHVLAFAGTSPTSWANWKANLRQAFGGGSTQYDSGMALAREYYAATGGNIHFTGHSLGGGIASAAAVWTGGSATVFNAAGVHANTLGSYSPSRGSVTYFYSSTDVLRLGNALTPASVPGEHVSLGRAGLHGMGGVCQAMGC